MNFQAINRIAMWRVFILSMSGFIFNTTEFIPVALLTDIGKNFAMSAEQTGIMITLYAWIVALCSLPFMLLTAHIERRKLLLILFAIFITSHIICVIAWNFPVLMIGRMGIAFAHSVFWAITAALVMRVAPRSRKTQAIGLFAMGVSLATVLGLPLGRLIGQFFGWRMTFAIIAVIAGLIMISLWRILPQLPSKNSGDLSSLSSLIRRPALLCLFAVTVIFVSGHFTAYSYIEPFALKIGGFSSSHTTLILLWFGIAGIIGSLVFNRFQPPLKQHYLPLCLFISTAMMLLFAPILASKTLWIILLLIWGIAEMGVILCLQIRVLKLAPDATDVASAIYSGIFNLGIGGGALIGSQIAASSFGLNSIGYTGAAFVLTAFALTLWLNRLSRHLYR